MSRTLETAAPGKIKPLLRLIGSSGALLATKSALLGIRTVVLLLIAAHGRDTELANASLALSLAEMGRWIADFGTDIWNVRAIAVAKTRADESRTLTSALLIKAVGSVLVGMAILVVCRLELTVSRGTLGCIAAVLLVTSQVAGLTIAYFQAKDAIATLLPLLLPCGMTLAGTYLTLIFTDQWLLALVVMTGGEVCIVAMALVLLLRRVAFSRLSTVIADARTMARSCIPAAMFGIVVGCYSRLDTLVLGEYSLAALAVYTVAQRLFQPLQIAVTSFGSIVYTRAAHAYAQSSLFRRRLLWADLPAILGCAIVCSAILFLAGRMLIENVYPGYLAALPLLTIFCAALPILAFNSAAAGSLLGSGRYWTVLSVSILDLLLTYSLMIVLVRQRGALGAAESLLIGALINAVALSLAAFTTLFAATSVRHSHGQI